MINLHDFFTTICSDLFFNSHIIRTFIDFDELFLTFKFYENSIVISEFCGGHWGNESVSERCVCQGYCGSLNNNMGQVKFEFNDRNQSSAMTRVIRLLLIPLTKSHKFRVKDTTEWLILSSKSFSVL